MLKLYNITKIYRASTQEAQALNDVNISFNSAEFVAILGSSVCGKIMFLNTLALILAVFISAAVYSIYSAENIVALPWVNAFILIGISVLLFLVAGFIAACLAAKKDPVEALRSE